MTSSFVIDFFEIRLLKRRLSAKLFCFRLWTWLVFLMKIQVWRTLNGDINRISIPFCKMLARHVTLCATWKCFLLAFNETVLQKIAISAVLFQKKITYQLSHRSSPKCHPGVHINALKQKRWSERGKREKGPWLSGFLILTLKNHEAGFKGYCIEIYRLSQLHGKNTTIHYTQAVSCLTISCKQPSKNHKYIRIWQPR